MLLVHHDQANGPEGGKDGRPGTDDHADLPAMIADIRAISEGKMDSNQKEFRVHKPDGSIVPGSS